MAKNKNTNTQGVCVTSTDGDECITHECDAFMQCGNEACPHCVSTKHWWQCEWRSADCVNRASEWHPAIQMVLCDWHSTVVNTVDEVMAK